MIWNNPIKISCSNQLFWYATDTALERRVSYQNSWFKSEWKWKPVINSNSISKLMHTTYKNFSYKALLLELIWWQVFCFHLLAFKNKDGTAEYRVVIAGKGYIDLKKCNLLFPLMFETVHIKIDIVYLNLWSGTNTSAN